MPRWRRARWWWILCPILDLWWMVLVGADRNIVCVGERGPMQPINSSKHLGGLQREEWEWSVVEWKERHWNVHARLKAILNEPTHEILSGSIAIFEGGLLGSHWSSRGYDLRSSSVNETRCKVTVYELSSTVKAWAVDAMNVRVRNCIDLPLDKHRGRLL